MRYKLVLLACILALANVVAASSAPSNTVICICNYASRLMHSKKEKEGVKLLEQVFKRQPDFALARTNLGIGYHNLALSTTDAREAITYIHRSIALTPDDKNSEKSLEFVLRNGRVNVATLEDRLKYAESLKSEGDEVGAYVEFRIAMKIKDDVTIQHQIDNMVLAEDRAKAATVGGIGPALLLKKIEVDHSKDEAFNFDYTPFVRAVDRKVQSHWKAPASLGNKMIEVSFVTNAGGSVSSLKVTKSCGDKTTDSLAVNAVKSAAPFKPLSSAVFFDIPVTLAFDARGDKPAVLYLNGEAKPDGVRFSTGTELLPMITPKNVDAKLQAKADAALNAATKYDQEVAQMEKQFGADSEKLCLKLRAAATFYIQAGEHKLAEERLGRAISIAEKAKAGAEQAAALSQLGALHYNLNRNAEAETDLKKAIDLMENSPEGKSTALRGTMEMYAKVLYKLNRVAEADRVYNQIKSLTVR